MRFCVVAASVFICALVGNGCAPVIAGGLILKASKTKGQREQFMADLRQTNLEREKAGLSPLDWCSEAYKFDSDWADDDTGCESRIKAYETGDKTALTL